MGKKGRFVLFVISLLLTIGVAGYIGFRIVRVQQEASTYRASQADTSAEAVKSDSSVAPAESVRESSVSSSSTGSSVVAKATATPTPTPAAKTMISIRGDILDEDGSTDTSYPDYLSQLLEKNGYTNYTVENNTWDNSGTLSQMALAGVSENDINTYITAHQNNANGAELDATEYIVRDDLSQYKKDRDDLDAIPVICMGYYGGWNNDPNELAEQIQKILDTYTQKNDYVVVGMYPYNEVDTASYDQAMTDAFGDHYLALTSDILDQPAFDDAGHQEIAQAIYDKLNSLGYLKAQTSAESADSNAVASASEAQ
ncbi:MULTISPECIES: hypothetical protein [unclassified Bilifractor]|uniref:hypothetical protein n=1 Tax=unclassified Bilifractor TaxID=2815795 RepID=UPI003F938818